MTIATTYFYVIAQDQRQLQASVNQNQNYFASTPAAEHFSVYGFSQSGELGFYINNTGVAISITSYWILNSTTGGVIQYQGPTSSPLNPALPFNIPQGSSKTFNASNLNPQIIIGGGSKYVVKVLTREGITGIGTYPSQQLTGASVSSLVAGGFGSLEMIFSSFEWYSYVSGPPKTVTYGSDTFNNLCASATEKETNCNGGASWKLDMAHAHSGSLTSGGYNTTGCGGNCNYQIPIAFSVNVTNQDPSLGNIVLNSQSNLWVIETCDSGVTEGNCPSGNPFFVFYLMNVNSSTGTITSTTSGSFAEIQIPYGVTKTLYYGAAYDLSLQPYSPVGLTSALTSNPFYYGQFAVFLLFAGTKIITSTSYVYGQNIPFESTTAADNFGWYSQTPINCNPGASTTFTLNVNNSIFSNPQTPFGGTNGINKIVINATAFSGIASVVTPGGWTYAGNSPSAGYITYTANSAASYIKNGTQLSFQWKANAPSPPVTTQYVFPLTITWKGGQVNTMQAATVCTVT